MVELRYRDHQPLNRYNSKINCCLLTKHIPHAGKNAMRFTFLSRFKCERRFIILKLFISNQAVLLKIIPVHIKGLPYYGLTQYQVQTIVSFLNVLDCMSSKRIDAIITVMKILILCVMKWVILQQNQIFRDLISGILTMILLLSATFSYLINLKTLR